MFCYIRYCDGISKVRSLVVVPATTSSPGGGANRSSSPWRSCEPCPVLGEPVTCSSLTPPDEEPPAKKKRHERPHLPDEPKDLVMERHVVVVGGPGLEGLVQQPCSVGGAVGSNSLSRVGGEPEEEVPWRVPSEATPRPAP